MDKRPNLIYILGDDQRAEQLGHMDHPIVRTPNIDRLASDGWLPTRRTAQFSTSCELGSSFWDERSRAMTPHR